MKTYILFPNSKLLISFHVNTQLTSKLKISSTEPLSMFRTLNLTWKNVS